MSELLHQLPTAAAQRAPDAAAVRHKAAELSYAELAEAIDAVGGAFARLGLGRGERVGIYLPKQIENVLAMFGACAAGGVFVPVNPLLKPLQVQHILTDCSVTALVTSPDRLAQLADVLTECPALTRIILIGDASRVEDDARVIGWDAFIEEAPPAPVVATIDTDVAAILYTSGSTGRPKGVVLSHRNMVAGARSVAQYLENTPQDRLLAVLPFSFDYGFSQLSTAFVSGACVVLMDYLLPRDVIRTVVREKITGLAGVPPLWVQLAGLEWPDGVDAHLRYITNSGGHMPQTALDALRRALPKTQPVLMYGLTEAFRSTYLPPADLDARPGSMGKAIPNAEILVVRPDGSLCDVDEPGELVHRGALVALGYWNDPEKTALRFRSAPGQPAELPLDELAVWSGDTVRRDTDGYLYFVGRRDEMIKTSGYRVSPGELEEYLYASGLVAEAVALGPKHPDLGQGIVVVAVASPDGEEDTDALLTRCRKDLPNYMVPALVAWRSSLPRNPNGKLDRSALSIEFEDIFS
ncbi:MAG: acyl-CoA ligase (AMP-forming), exosortase A system-associated [Pseudomonadota bacterium]